MKVHEDDSKPTRLKIIVSLGYLLATLLLAVTLTAIQSNRAGLKTLQADLEREVGLLSTQLDNLETRFDSELLRLTEESRDGDVTHGQLSALDAEFAVLIEELRRDIDRIGP